MSAPRALPLAALAALALLAPAGAEAAPPPSSPAWDIQALAAPTNFTPGDESGLDRYQAFLTNSGGAPTDHSKVTITDTLPPGIGVKGVALFPPRHSNQDISAAPVCETQTSGEISTVTCEVTDAVLPGMEPAKVNPGEEYLLEIHVSTPPAASGTLVNAIEVKGGGAPTASVEGENQATSEPAGIGFEEFHADLSGPDGLPVTGADSHPYQYSTSFAVNLVPSPPGSGFPFVPAGGDLKNVEVALPPGLSGNPTAVERCTSQQFNTTHHGVSSIEENVTPNACPAASAVGLAMIQQKEGKGEVFKVPVYNLVPPQGMPAQLGFRVAAPIYINTRLRSDGDYGVSGFLENVTEAQRVTAARVMIWGTPWDHSHDSLRGECADLSEGTCEAQGGTARPFWRLPSSCADPLLTTMSFETWAQPSQSASESAGAPAPVGCAAPDFSPTIESRASTDVADSPAGLHFAQHLPQGANEDPEGLGEADQREALVTLPKGMVVNPASANGRAACTSAQIGLATAPGAVPLHFDKAPARCPAAAKLGRVEATTPLLDHPLPGAVYLAAQGDNPFKSLLAIYIVLEDPQSGVVVKLAGRVSPDPADGQLATVVGEIPQAPVEDFKFDFFEGPRAGLRSPAACGTYTTTTTLVPWTAPEGVAAEPSDSFQIAAGPAGPCPSGALEPKLSAGLANPTAATYSPFSARLTRADGTDEFAGLTTDPPPGLLARLAGVPYCPESGIAQALSRTAPGEGAEELASPSCPAASRVGGTAAGAGAGPSPFFTGGEIYLAGPYKGAPISLVAIIPALAGPFDLGVVTDRVAAHIDPETAQVSAVADPLPTILAGIPVDVRDIRVNLDRPNFALAPTNCEPKSVDATVLGRSGAAAKVSDRFQVGGCKELPFKPKFSLRLKGGTRRNQNPAFRAVLTYPKAPYANVASVSVGLPHAEFLAQSHIRTICTRVQFAAEACPKGSIYGRARAITPLLDQPLQGPVYLRSSSHPLPDMVIALHGQVDADLVGRIDSHKGGIRTSFEAVPDAPVTKFVLEMPGGAKSLLVNSRNICNHLNRATVRSVGHNGKTYDARPVLHDSCKGAKPKKRR